MMYKFYYCYIWMSLYILFGIKLVFSVFILYGNLWVFLIQLCKFCNYGICINIVGSFYCICLLFFYGLRCQLDEDECFFNFCNGEECINKIGSYECVCGNFIIGINCERLVVLYCINKMCYYYGMCNN